MTLPYFDRNKYTTLQTDASKKGFGAVILQEKKPNILCIKEFDTCREKLPKFGARSNGRDLGDGKVPFLFVREGIQLTDRSKATYIHIQKASRRCFTTH